MKRKHHFPSSGIPALPLHLCRAFRPTSDPATLPVFQFSHHLPLHCGSSGHGPPRSMHSYLEARSRRFYCKTPSFQLFYTNQSLGSMGPFSRRTRGGRLSSPPAAAPVFPLTPPHPVTLVTVLAWPRQRCGFAKSDLS